MSNEELTFLIDNLEYDVAEYMANRVNIINRGSGYLLPLWQQHLVTVYLELISQYDLDVMTINPLDSDEMVNILNHTNVILNKNYNYDFKEGGFVF